MGTEQMQLERLLANDVKENQKGVHTLLDEENIGNVCIKRSLSNLTKALHNEEQPRSKFTFKQKIALVTLSSADFMCYCSMSIMAPFFPKKASAVGMTETVAGFVFSFYALVIFISSPLFGKIIPKLGVRTSFTAGLVVAGSANICFGMLDYVQNLTVFTTLSFVIRGAEALGSSAYSTASYILITSIFPDHSGFVRGVLEVFVGLGLSAGPAMGGFLYTIGGFQLPFYVIGALIIFLTFFNKCLIQKDDDQREEICGSFRTMISLPSVIMALVIVVVNSMSWSYLDPILEPYLRKYNLSAASIGLIFLLMSAAYGICSPIAGWLGDKLTNYWLLMACGLITAGISLLFVGPSPLFSFLTESLWWDIGGLGALGISIAIALLPTYRAVLDATLSEGSFEDNIATQGLVAGVWSSLYSLGEVIGPITGGVLYNQWGLPITNTVMSSLNLLTAVIIIIYYVYVRRKAKVKHSAEEKCKENGFAAQMNTGKSETTVQNLSNVSIITRI